VRILLVVDSLDVGGAERHVTDLALALHARGHRVVVACATGGPLLHELESAGISIRVLCDRAVKHRIDFLFARRLRRVLRAGAFDLVHTHLYASTIAASLATIGMGCALVVTVHSEGKWQRRIARAVSGRMYRSADALVAVSEPIAQQLTARHRVARERTVVIANALYLPAPASTTELPSWCGAGLVVGVVCRLHRDKGVDVLLDAMARVLARRPDVQTVVVGDGPQRDHLQRKACVLGLRDRVRFLGCRHGARSLISTFDLLIVPSRTEGSPIVVLEAMAAGVPVVASRVGGIPDQIRHGVDGLLVPADNARELAKAIEQLLSQPATRREFAAEGRRHVAHQFAYRNLLNGMECVYAQALVRVTVRSTAHR
jgi:glycosyltransferase involved in cell wall biosynthesis